MESVGQVTEKVVREPATWAAAVQVAGQEATGSGKEETTL